MTKSIDSGNLPETLYKYRSWSEEYHKKIICDQEIYFSQPSSFNDPFDGNIPVRWDLLTYEDCFKKNFELVQTLFENQSVEIQKEIAQQKTDSKEWFHPDNIKKESEDDIDKWDKLIGLISLSEKRDNILMWSHYSNHHRGFVVGLNTKSLIEEYDFGDFKRVNYQEEYPIVNGLDDVTGRFKTKFFTKSSLWSYEAEWRIAKNHIKNRVVRLKKETIKEVILGCRIEEEVKKQILSISKRNLPFVKIYQAVVDPGKIKLNIVEI